MDISSRVKLNNGVEMPWMGLGVFQLPENGRVEKAVSTALKNGYRHIDTAYAYHNEEGVGRGIKISSIPRSDLFISSKIGNEQQGYESTRNALQQTLKALQTDYLDLYHIHWPQGKKTLETWKVMEDLYNEGLIRAIGVSNFKIHHLEYLLANSKIVPAVNQVEFHPRNSNPVLHEFCRSKNIQLVAWSPLMRGEAMNIHEINAIAKKYNKTPVQIILRWNLQKQVVTIPRSGNNKRIIDNSKIFDFVLYEKDMVKIDALNRDKPIIQKRDRIKYLLEMLWNQKYDKRLIKLLSDALYKKVRPRIDYV